MTDANGPVAGLLKQIAYQDRGAFADLYRAVSAKVYGVALRILGNKPEAELTLKQVFTRLWHNAGRFDPEHERGMDFIITMTRDIAIDRRRARPEMAGVAESETRYMEREEGMRVTACMAKLDPGCVQALRAGYLGGLSYAELTAVTGREGDMRPYMRDCLTSLMGCVGEEEMHGVAPPADDGSDDGLLAAEFVLGALSHDERREAEQRLGNPAETGFRAHVAAWRARFSPLNAAYVAVSAPDLRTAIEGVIFGTPVSVQQTNLKRLGMAMAGGIAAVIAVAWITIVAVKDMTPAPELYAATLESRGKPLIFSAAWDSGTRRLEVLRTGGQAAGPGQAYRLWLVAPDGQTKPLLTLQGDETISLVSRLPRGAKLGVTLESAGAAPDAPSGPMLVTGQVSRL